VKEIKRWFSIILPKKIEEKLREESKRLGVFRGADIGGFVKDPRRAPQPGDEG